MCAATVLAANALVGSRFDNYNSFGSPSALDSRRLQCVQNSLALITPIRNSLHWLPTKPCSVFKMTLLVCKFLHSGCPKYF